jgi:hypothetical protein
MSCHSSVSCPVMSSTSLTRSANGIPNKEMPYRSGSGVATLWCWESEEEKENS